MEDIFYPSHDGKNTVHACIWRPEGEVKGIVQIIHGMAEYAARYTSVAEFLNKHGYLVCAEDHLGHGKTAAAPDDLGYFNDARDYKMVLDDIRELQLTIQKQYPGQKYYVLGHSMGSFFCRSFIALYGEELSGAIIMGTGFKSSAALNLALSFVRTNARFHGWRNRSNFIKNLAFGSYNKKFKPARTANDWLSVDSKNVDNYEKDELCGFDFTNNGYYILFSVIKNACAKKTIKAVPKNLPVLFVAGNDDPVGDYGNGVKKAAQKFREAGVRKVQLILYKNARHEILNDNCRKQVNQDILNFISSL